METPQRTLRHRLGGSAVFFGLAAAAFAPTQLVAAVGDDLPQADLDLLAGCGVDLSCVARLSGKSHHWRARYSADLSAADTLENDLGVMAGWQPAIPAQRPGDLLFIGSLEPAVQLGITHRAHQGAFTAIDTQSHWIALDRATVLEAAGRCAMICVTETEILELTRAGTVDDAAAVLLAHGTEAVVVKAGIRGATLYHARGKYTSPSVAPTRIEDPTGAGDSFAGGMLGHLATLAMRDFDALVESLHYGVACGSLALERPAGQRISCWSRNEIRDRRDALLRVMKA